MKKQNLFLLCISVVFLLSSFTQKEASQAIDDFNKHYFNPSTGLYYANSDRTGRAAIWTQAIYWDMVMNAYKRTQDDKYLGQIEAIYQGGYKAYDKYNWNNKKEWFIYDDMMWWIISMGRAYQITHEPKYLAHASAGFYRVWVDSYDPKDGGLFWAFDHHGKTSCINYPTIIGAMTLYDITGNNDYLEKAKDIYQWARTRLFDHGKVADNQIGDNTPDWTTNLYNQATCIGAAMMLYVQTKDPQYLNDAILTANYSKEKMSDSEGILFFKNGIEQGIYTAIFSQYMIRLIEDGNQTQFIPWLQNNIAVAWRNRDQKRGLTFKDASKPCPKGTIEVYDASGCPALMQVIKPVN